MAFLGRARSILQQTVSKHINHEIAASTLPPIFQLIRCMSSKLFVGGLSYQTDETSFREAFENYGHVLEARIIKDRESGNSRGFGFVTYADTEAASSAIMALDGKDFQGRTIRVNHAHDKARGGGGGGGYGSYGGGYGAGSSYGGSSYNPGANYGAADSYASGGGSYGSSGGNYGNSGNYASNGGNLGSDRSNYNDDFSYDSVNNQHLGVAGGGGGSDNYFAGGNSAGNAFSSTGYDSNPGSSFGGNQFGYNESYDMANSDGSHNRDDQLQGNFQDDSEPHDFLGRRAS